MEKVEKFATNVLIYPITILDRGVQAITGFNFGLSRNIVSAALSVFATILTRLSCVFLNQKVTYKIPSELLYNRKIFFAIFMIYMRVFVITLDARQAITDPPSSHSSKGATKLPMPKPRNVPVDQIFSIEFFKTALSSKNYSFLHDDNYSYDKDLLLSNLVSAATQLARDQNKTVAEILNEPQEISGDSGSKRSLFWVCVGSGFHFKTSLMELLLKKGVNINQHLSIYPNSIEDISIIVQLIRLKKLNSSSLKYIKTRWETINDRNSRKSLMRGIKVVIDTEKQEIYGGIPLFLKLADCTLDNFKVCLDKVFNSEGEWIYPISDESI